MSRLIQLPDELYERLEKAAEAEHTTPVGWLKRHIPELPPPATARHRRATEDAVRSDEGPHRRRE
jgi:hypothetical protein